jgi:hypothetical protein
MFVYDRPCWFLAPSQWVYILPLTPKCFASRWRHLRDLHPYDRSDPRIVSYPPRLADTAAVVRKLALAEVRPDMIASYWRAVGGMDPLEEDLKPKFIDHDSAVARGGDPYLKAHVQ